MKTNSQAQTKKRLLIPCLSVEECRWADVLKEQVAIHPLVCMQAQPLKHNIRLGQAISEVESYRWIVFLDELAVNIWFDSLRMRRIDVRSLNHIKFAVATASIKKTLEQYGVLAEYMPLSYSQQCFADGLVSRVHQKEKLLLLRGRQTVQVCTATFGKAGLAYDEVLAYEYQKLPQTAILAKEDIVAFTSPMVVEYFDKTLLEVQQTVVCIDKPTAEYAEKHNFTAIQTTEATFESLIHSISEMV